MSAFLNALREEGTKEDCLRQVERLLDEKRALVARLHNLEVAARRVLNAEVPAIWEKDAEALNELEKLLGEDG